MEQPASQTDLKLSNVEFATKWADITIDKLLNALDLHDIGQLDGDLWRSLKREIVKSGGDVSKVITRFLQHGRFVDMGVGRGVPIGAAGTSAFSAARNPDGTLKKYRRKPKKWFSRTYYREVMRFAELYSENFGKQIPVQISEALSQQITITP